MLFRRMQSVIFSLFAVCCTALAQAPQALNEPSLLWEVSGNGLSNPSYVYGTIHVMPRKDFFITEASQKALEASEKVVFEIDLEKMTDLSAMLPMMMQAFMKKDTTLRDLLSPEEYQLIKGHFQEMGLPMFMLDRIKPMFLSALDPQTMSGSSGEEVTSYEMEFMAIAQKSGKTIEGLETAAFQMSMFDSIPYRVQAKMLLEAIRSSSPEVSEDEGSFDKMVEMYKKQDIEGMQQFMKGDQELMAYENLLLINRNRNWIPVMKKMMQGAPCFFAVGAGHLGGPQGILELLRAEGFSVKAKL